MIGFWRSVIAVTRIGMLNSSSATWPCDSPNGDSGSTYSVSIRPSITISASAGTSRSTVRARTTLMGAPAGDQKLVGVERKLLRSHEGDIGRAAEHDRARHGLVAALLMREVVLIAAGAADPRRHAHHQTIRRFQRRAVGAHVLNEGVRIARDHIGRGQRRRAVEARRRDRDRQPVEAAALAL